MARIALCIIYVWFGILKVIGQSPASPLVKALFMNMHLNFMPFSSFIVLFGLFEVVIGILFVIPGLEKIAFIAFGIHIATTALPLCVMGSLVWTHPFVPTLEGQYIVKNLALIACALFIASSLQPKHALGEKFEI